LRLEKFLPITTSKIFGLLEKQGSLKKNGWEHLFARSSTLLGTDGRLRNACLLAQGEHESLVVVLVNDDGGIVQLEVTEQHEKPFAMFECKRVGVEEGMRKGPQTIEKAKQGAYVARTVSSLQKIRNENGELYGVLPIGDGKFKFDELSKILNEVIKSNDKSIYEDFILTVGIVSNHGNWFTSENPNKELLVLKDAYDWLLFLTDSGLAMFIDELLLNPSNDYSPVQQAFLSSYNSEKGSKKQYGKNQFTKVQINEEADLLLQKYFRENREKVKSWLNVISPKGGTLDALKEQLLELSKKDW
jgi:hypothetical protein